MRPSRKLFTVANWWSGSDMADDGTQTGRRPRIAVFGHYGNQNLGDEAIIEAVMANLRKHIPGVDLHCFSINPFDSAQRHNVPAFPIRYRSDYPAGLHYPSGHDSTAPVAATSERPSASTEVPGTSLQGAAKKPSWKARVKSFPVLGSAVALLQKAARLRHTLPQEAGFLRFAKAQLEDIDLLLVTGSNQFLDNFGGPWGFPYTLLKWTLLAKQTNTRVAFISIGAGPLSHPLSFWMLRRALRRADYLSFRDQGSFDLISDKVGIGGPVVPDLAHSLSYQPPEPGQTASEDSLHIAVNPMPVFDSRYWHVGDDTRYREYVGKLADLCTTILSDGARLTLFSTQLRDEDVITDVMTLIAQGNTATTAQQRITVAKSRSVRQLMDTLSSADLVVATRFHATVLPLQLGIPVLGICYYRKAAELLDDVGLGAYHVDINGFASDQLIAKYQNLVSRISQGDVLLHENLTQYQRALDIQYQQIAALILPEKTS